MWDRIVPAAMAAPKFSAYPWPLVPRRTRRDAALESAIARWLAARPHGGGKLARLTGGAVRVSLVRAGDAVAPDPLGASCELRIRGEVIDVHGGGAGVRALAQRLLGGPEELAAPRPLGAIERALWALAVAAAVDDLGVEGEVWGESGPSASGGGLRPDQYAVELALELCGARCTVVIAFPKTIELRVPPVRAMPAWAERAEIDARVVVARCAVEAAAVAGLAVRDLITVEPCCALEILGGELGLRAAPKALVAEVITEYVRRDMALANDAEVELAVTLGTTRIPLRQALGLAIGEIIQLNRPLAGPFEIRAAGQLVGQGELVDVDGELAVRIVSLEEK